MVDGLFIVKSKLPSLDICPKSTYSFNVSLDESYMTVPSPFEARLLSPQITVTLIDDFESETTSTVHASTSANIPTSTIASHLPAIMPWAVLLLALITVLGILGKAINHQLVRPDRPISNRTESNDTISLM